VWTKLANRKEKGLQWEDEILLKVVQDELGRTTKLIVVPQTFMDKILEFVLDKNGHKWVQENQEDNDEAVYLARVWERCGSLLHVGRLTKSRRGRTVLMVARPALSKKYKKLHWIL